MHNDTEENECRRGGTCIFHTGNMELFDDFKNQLRDLATAVNRLDVILVKADASGKSRMIFTGFIGAAILACFGYLNYEITSLRATELHDMATLSATVNSGMNRRTLLEEQMRHLADDIAEIQRKQNSLDARYGFRR